MKQNGWLGRLGRFGWSGWFASKFVNVPNDDYDDDEVKVDQPRLVKIVSISEQGAWKKYFNRFGILHMAIHLTP